VNGRIIVTDVFGKGVSAKVVFKEISLDKARSFVTDIDKIDIDMSRQLRTP
jgi:hypothetical protein